MGAKQNSLEVLLQGMGRKITKKQLPRLTSEAVLDSDYGDVVEKVYRSLGGVLDVVPIKLGKWDVEVGGIAVELDEHLHFNRYRKTTLNSPVYSQLPAFPLKEYEIMCGRFEGKCLSAGSYGRKWTNKSCEKQYGVPGECRDLSGRGAPRWKQRAFYDFVKDMTVLILGVKLVRISIWDTIVIAGKTYSVEDLLNRCDVEAADPLWALIESRL